MGYTHYWTRTDVKITDKQWKNITTFGRKLYKAMLEQGIPLVHEYDQPHSVPEFTRELIMFNGLAGDGHETFYLERNPVPRHPSLTPGFAFCKTARKPYDVAVVAMLAAMQHYAPNAWDISSDGDYDEWLDGLSVFKHIAGEEPPRMPCFDTEEEVS